MYTEYLKRLEVFCEDENDDSHDEDLAHGTKTLVDTSSKTKVPSFYKVIILNDDFTPREYVVHVLQKFFKKGEEEATNLMLQVHHQGKGVAGIYTFEIAETKAYQVNEYSRQNQYPLKCAVEKA